MANNTNGDGNLPFAAEGAMRDARAILLWRMTENGITFPISALAEWGHNQIERAVEWLDAIDEWRGGVGECWPPPMPDFILEHANGRTPKNTETGKSGNLGPWLPIETAPKDGTVVLLVGGFRLNGRPSLRTGRWVGLRPERWIDEALGTCLRTPTHWMPIPPPPE